MINLLLNAFLLGLIGGAIPGPVLTAIFTEILQSGFTKSLRLIFQAMFSESAVALLTLVLLSSLNLSPSIFNGLSIVGAIILLWMATSIWKINKIDVNQKIHLSFWKISAMILANGLLWSFWITVCVPKAIELNQVIRFGNLLFLVLCRVRLACFYHPNLFPFL